MGVVDHQDRGPGEGVREIPPHPARAPTEEELRGQLDRIEAIIRATGGPRRELSGYAGQRETIKRELAPYESSWRNLSIEVATVGTFQGREADIAIYSVTRSNPEGSIGFLAESRRLNVALSRGRDAPGDLRPRNRARIFRRACSEQSARRCWPACGTSRRLGRTPNELRPLETSNRSSAAQPLPRRDPRSG